MQASFIAVGKLCLLMHMFHMRQVSSSIQLACIQHIIRVLHQCRSTSEKQQGPCCLAGEVLQLSSLHLGSTVGLFLRRLLQDVLLSPLQAAQRFPLYCICKDALHCVHPIEGLHVLNPIAGTVSVIM